MTNRLRQYITEMYMNTNSYTPDLDGTYYGMVMSVGSPSVHPSVCVGQFYALFSYMLWQIELKFCIFTQSTSILLKYKV